MREGRLGYNCENGRYGLLSMDLWIDTGFHCGECMEVLVDDQWVKTRMEMNLAREWYLVGTPYCGDLEYVRARIPMHLLTAKQARAGKENAYRQTFIYQTKQAV